MIYVKKLIIENFQSHKYTELELDTGLNVIVGPSDQGKSAIIRALKWVFFNEPRGFEFLRHGETNAKVTVCMSNGNIVTRERSPSKNRYTVTDENDEIQVYEGFGNDIPQEVINAHRVEKALIDTNSDIGLNLADQLEAPFLLSENGGVKAKAIGRLTGVHIIDKAVAMTLADIKRENLNKNKIDEDFSKTVEDLKIFEGIEEKIENLKECENILSYVQKYAERLDKLNSLAQRLSSSNEEFTEQNKTLEKFKNLDKVTIQVNDLENKYNLYYRLKDFNIRIESISKQISEQSIIIEKTKNIDNIIIELTSAQEITKKLETEKSYSLKLATINRNISFESSILEKLKTIDLAEKHIASGAEIVLKLNKLKTIQNKYIENKYLIQKGNQFLKERQEEIEQLVERYGKVLKDIGKCPVCLSDIDNDTFCHIIGSMKGE